jgi:hypothetical protein
MKIQGRKLFEKKRETHTPFSIIEAAVRARTKDGRYWLFLLLLHLALTTDR